MIASRIALATERVIICAGHLDTLAGWARDNDYDRGVIRRDLAFGELAMARNLLTAALANLEAAIGGEGKT